MAMIPGSVTVNDDETHTGSGMALPLYEALKTIRPLPDPSLFDAPISNVETKLKNAQTDREALSPTASEAQVSEADQTIDFLKQSLNATKKAKEDAILGRVKMLRDWAIEAVAVAGAIVPYIQAEAELVTTNLKAQVSTSAVLGRTPDPNDPNTNIQPPSAAVDLPTAAVGGAVRIH